MPATVSPREKTLRQLVDYLEGHRDRWSAPYGVLTGWQPIGTHTRRAGKVHTVTFGIARYLDACAYIWSVNRITLDGSGPASLRLLKKREFSSVKDLIAHLENV